MHQNTLSIRLFAALALLTAVASPVAAYARDQVGFSTHITVPTEAEQESANPTHDVVCAFCTVDVHGPIHGDLVTLFSTVNVDPNVEVSGDTVTAGSSLKLGESVILRKDLVFFAGNLTIPSSVTVGKDRVIFDGGIWMLALFAPLLIGLGVLWLIVWVILRIFRPAPRYGYPPPPPPGYYGPR